MYVSMSLVAVYPQGAFHYTNVDANNLLSKTSLSCNVEELNFKHFDQHTLGMLRHAISYAIQAN